MSATLSTDMRLQQAQILAPQMQQSLKILQTTSQELQTLLEQQVAINPTLEEYDPAYDSELGELQSFDPDTQDTAGAYDERTRTLDDDRLELAGLADTPEAAFEKELDHLNTSDSAWGDYYNAHEEYGTHGGARERVSYREAHAGDEEQHNFRMQSIASETTLADDLRQQFHSQELSPAELDVADYVIGSLDHNGFLPESIEELAHATHADPATVEKIVSLLRSFDPPGIGAKDARESLMQQLERQGRADTLGYRLLRDCSADLANNRWHQIARALDVTVEEISAAITELSTLDPRPGRDLNVRTAPALRPDIIVTRMEDGRYHCETNDNLLPYVRVNPKIRTELKSRAYDRSVSKYLRQQLREGELLLNNVAFRKRTVLAVAEAIVEAQKEFLDEGPTHLRPLSMKEIADKVGVHEATVSRTVNQKYMDTPQGLYEMRSFFSAHVSEHDGHEVSARAVQAKLKELIEQENKRAPYSDEKLAHLLRAEGFPVARRTVVKYRTALDIPNTRQRKTFV